MKQSWTVQKLVSEVPGLAGTAPPTEVWLVWLGWVDNSTAAVLVLCTLVSELRERPKWYYRGWVVYDLGTDLRSRSISHVGGTRYSETPAQTLCSVSYQDGVWTRKE